MHFTKPVMFLSFSPVPPVSRWTLVDSVLVRRTLSECSSLRRAGRQRGFGSSVTITFKGSTVTPLRFRTVTAFIVHTVLSQWAPPALSFICFLLSPVSWRKLPVSFISHCRSGLMGGNRIRILNLNVMRKHSLQSLSSVILIMRTAKTNKVKWSYLLNEIRHFVSYSFWNADSKIASVLLYSTFS